MTTTCPACGADKGVVGVTDGHLCLECKRREGIDDTTFSDRDFGIGIPGVIAEECYKLRDALHERQEEFFSTDPLLEKARVFSKLNFEDRLRVRVDHVLMRLLYEGANEENERELVESLVMLRVARRLYSSEGS